MACAARSWAAGKGGESGHAVVGGARGGSGLRVDDGVREHRGAQTRAYTALAVESRIT